MRIYKNMCISNIVLLTFSLVLNVFEKLLYLKKIYAFEKQFPIQYAFLFKREITINIKHLGYITLFFIVNVNK